MQGIVFKNKQQLHKKNLSDQDVLNTPHLHPTRFIYFLQIHAEVEAGAIWHDWGQDEEATLGGCWDGAGNEEHLCHCYPVAR